jgi:AcrR family transcriptional regulator
VVTLGTRTARTDRVVETRDAIMTAAEQLCAEHGLAAVSNRQIAEVAGQGNVTVVSYHFGTKAGLVRAIMTRHAETMEQIRQRMLDEIGDSDELRDWVGCMVRPLTEHLASLGVPSWYARLAVQVMTDPALRAAITDEALDRQPLRRTLDGLTDRLASVPFEVRTERGDMARHLILHTCAEHERALALGTTPPKSSWERTAVALTDALTGLFLAPVTQRPNLEENDQ